MTENKSGSAEEQEANEMPTVGMRHIFHKQDRVLYFYEGRLPVVAGLIEVPADKAHWGQRAHILGYRMNDAGEPRDLAETLALFARLEAGEVTPTEAEVESAESAEETTDEAPDGGRQPLSDDGVRSSAEDGDGSLPDAGLGSGDGDGAAAGSGGDDSAGEAVRPS